MKRDEYKQPIKASIDTKNSLSLVCLVEGDAFKNAVEKVPDVTWSFGEDELREKARPTKTDYALRIALWNEIRIASATNTKIQASRIFASICSYQHWYNNVLNNPTKLAWMLLPLQDFEQSLEPLLVRIAERYDEILNLNIYDSKGNPIPALVKLVLRTMEQIEGRLKGAVVQKVESKNLGMDVAAIMEMSEEEMNKKMSELEERERVLIRSMYGREPFPGETLQIGIANTKKM